MQIVSLGHSQNSRASNGNILRSAFDFPGTLHLKTWDGKVKGSITPVRDHFRCGSKTNSALQMSVECVHASQKVKSATRLGANLTQDAVHQNQQRCHKWQPLHSLGVKVRHSCPLSIEMYFNRPFLCSRLCADRWVRSAGVSQIKCKDPNSYSGLFWRVDPINASVRLHLHSPGHWCVIDAFASLPTHGLIRQSPL
jgi:hypothetical protein